MTDPNIADTDEDSPRESCDCENCKSNPLLVEFVDGYDAASSFAENGALIDELLAKLKEDPDCRAKALERITDMMHQFDAARANFVLAVSIKPANLRVASPLLQGVVSFSKRLETACFEVGKELMKTEDMPDLIKEAAKTIADTIIAAFRPKPGPKADDENPEADEDAPPCGPMSAEEIDAMLDNAPPPVAAVASDMTTEDRIRDDRDGTPPVPSRPGMETTEELL